MKRIPDLIPAEEDDDIEELVGYLCDISITPCDCNIQESVEFGSIGGVEEE